MVLAETVAVAQHGGGVEALVAETGRVADHQRDAVQHFQFVEAGVDGTVEVFAQQQVFRAVAGQRQLRRDQHVGTLCHGRLGQLEDFAGVAGDVADNRVELGKCNAHRENHQ
ncbi:hypothetical protein D3C72_1907720 [compost metagenome]